MKKVRIAGVPEHFNLPWHLAIEEGAFEERGLQLEWIDVPEGTGRMCQMLEDGETDLAIILTEGIVKAIVEGNPSTIIQQYVGSPLYWGIHVWADGYHRNISDIQNKTAAISRYGSGSHLMAYIHADDRDWNTGNLHFEVVNNMDGAVEALRSGKADYFMWEHFTTKPLVDQGLFRRLADCPTPWPCFVIAGAKEFLEKEEAIIRHILEVINLFTREFKDIPSIDRMLSNRYELDLEDIRQWLSLTHWSQEQVSPETLKIVQDELLKLKIIPHALAYTELTTTL